MKGFFKAPSPGPTYEQRAARVAASAAKNRGVEPPTDPRQNKPTAKKATPKKPSPKTASSKKEHKEGVKKPSTVAVKKAGGALTPAAAKGTKLDATAQHKSQQQLNSEDESQSSTTIGLQDGSNGQERDEEGSDHSWRHSRSHSVGDGKPTDLKTAADILDTAEAELQSWNDVGRQTRDAQNAEKDAEQKLLASAAPEDVATIQNLITKGELKRKKEFNTWKKTQENRIADRDRAVDDFVALGGQMESTDGTVVSALSRKGSALQGRSTHSQSKPELQPKLKSIRSAFEDIGQDIIDSQNASSIRRKQTLNMDKSKATVNPVASVHSAAPASLSASTLRHRSVSEVSVPIPGRMSAGPTRPRVKSPDHSDDSDGGDCTQLSSKAQAKDRDESTDAPKIRDDDLRHLIQNRRRILRNPEGDMIFTAPVILLLERGLSLLKSDVECYEERVDYLKHNMFFKDDTMEILQRYKEGAIQEGTRLVDIGLANTRIKEIVLAEIAAIAEDLQQRTDGNPCDKEDISKRVHLLWMPKQTLLRQRKYKYIGPKSQVSDALAAKYAKEKQGRSVCERNPLRLREEKSKKRRESPRRRSSSGSSTESSQSRGRRHRSRDRERDRETDREHQKERDKTRRRKESEERDKQRKQDLRKDVKVDRSKLKHPDRKCTECDGIGHLADRCGTSATGVAWGRKIKGRKCHQCGGKDHGQPRCPSETK